MKKLSLILSILLIVTLLPSFVASPAESADGWSAPIQLTSNSASDNDPCISGDGTKIAFSSYVDGDYEIFVVNSDGSGLMQLTSNTANDYDPSICGDGSKIAFWSSMYRDTEIFVVNSDGTGFLMLTMNSAFDDSASICGDGSKIAFHSTMDGDAEIFVINSDGSGLTQITHDWAPQFNPSISGDGSKIAFRGIPSLEDTDYEIFVINYDGTGSLQLTNNNVDDWNPSISADGTKVAFSSNVYGDSEIFVVNSDGTGLTQLTSNTAHDGAPCISGDSSKIAFESDVDGDSEIFVVNSDGSGLTQLTSNSASDGSPSISFDGTKVAFPSDVDGDYEIFVISKETTDIETSASISFAPETVRVGNPVSVNILITPSPPTGSVYEGCMIHITYPDASTEIRGPIVTNPDGSGYFEFTPSQVGTTIVQFFYPGQFIDDIWYQPSQTTGELAVYHDKKALLIDCYPIPDPFCRWSIKIDLLLKMNFGQVDELVGNEVTAETLSEILDDGYDLIWWRAHGDEGSIQTGEKINSDQPWTDIVDHYNETWKIPVNTVTTLIQNMGTAHGNYVGITDDFILNFFSDHNTFQGALIYVEACETLLSSDFVDAFRTGGSSVYLGYDNKPLFFVADYEAVRAFGLFSYGCWVDLVCDLLFDLEYLPEDTGDFRLVESWTGDILEVFLGSPATLIITDPWGRKIGIDPSTGIQVNEIEGAACYGPEPDFEPQVIFIPNPPEGSYTVELTGTDNGAFHLSTSLITESGVNKKSVIDEITEGEEIRLLTSVYGGIITLSSVELLAGWNMVSFPVLPDDSSFSSIFGDVGFYQVLTWDGTSYISPTVAETGVGYWVLVLENTSIAINEPNPVTGYEMDLPAGWSMIGSIYGVTVDASSVFPGFYQLLTWDGTSYVTSTTIEPGKGYWALVLEPTTITVSG